MSIRPFRVLRADDAHVTDLSRSEAQLRATARQQEAVAHLGQQALAGVPAADLEHAAVGLVARALEVEFASLLELRPESRTLLLRAGVGWPVGSVGRTIVPADLDSHAGYVLRSSAPVVVEDLAADTRFGGAPLLDPHGVVSSLDVAVPGRERPFGLLGAHSVRRREFTIHDAHFLQSVANVLATAIDRARADAAVRESEAHFRSLIEHGSDIVTVVGENGVFRYASPSVERILGHAPSDLLERNAFDFIHPDDIAVVAEALARAIQRPATPQAARFRFRARDGSWRLLEAVGQARETGSGRAQLIVNARDVTERERQELALRRSEESSRALVQHAAHGIYRATPDGRFLAVNPALAKMLGYDSEEQLLAASLERDVYADAAERRRVLARFDHDADRAEAVEVTWRRRDGQPIVVRLSGRAVRRSDGATECFETIAEDVTERRALEEQLRQSQKMEAVGQLTGGIAHDFNNLLTIILANAQLVAKALGPEQADAHADLRDVMAAALRGRAMVKELLGFARRSSLDLQPVRLGDIVEELEGLLRRILPADVEIVVAGEARLPETRADVQAVEQILFNLVVNARDAMPAGGVLRIETRRARLDEERRKACGAPHAGAYVCLSVEDTGHGMDEETRRRMFEPFFTTKPAGKGTGLGLATVYGLLRQHQAGIEVDTAPGKGARFRLYFPVAEEGPAGGGPREGAAPVVRGGSETILVVEDDDQLRRSAKRILEDAGYQVVTAADGLEGLQALRHGTGIALVFSDVVMPRLGGRGLYDAARRDGYAVPFVFASGYSDPDGRGAGLDPAVPLLPKPWTGPDLLARIRAILDGA